MLKCISQHKKGNSLKLTNLLLIPLLCVTLEANEKILFAETINNSCEIEFENLVLDGLESHPSIEVARKSIEGAQFEVDSASWGYYPSPSVDYSLKSSDKNQITARLEQPIWTGGKLDSIYDKAKATQKEASYELEQNRYKLISNYAETLKEYLKANKKITVLNHNKKEFYQLSKMLDRFMDAGELSQTDKNLLNSRIASISSDLVITKAKHKVANIKLELLSGKKINCNINFKEQNILPTQLNLDHLITSLKDSHPTLKMIDAKTLAAIAEVENAKSKLWPSLVLRGEHVQGSIYQDEGSEPEDETLVYLSLNISTGAGLSGLSNIDKAKIDIKKVKFEKNTKLKELLDVLMADYTNYITAISHEKMVEHDIKIATLIYESNARLFLSQKKSWLDLVNSLSELSKQKVKYTELQVDKQILAYKIALQVGKIDLETLEVRSDI